MAGPRQAADAAGIDADRHSRQQPQAAAEDDPVKRYFRQAIREDYLVMNSARLDSALTTDSPFVERLVHFWANHFAVSVDKLPVIGLAGLLEFEAIRPHVLGRFSDMLLAVEQHPAMLLYLDQAQSIGPNSQAGQFRRDARRQAARASTRISRARSWSCTRSACAPATPRPTSPNSRGR